jgi:hypothetical protein
MRQQFRHVAIGVSGVANSPAQRRRCRWAELLLVAVGMVPLVVVAATPPRPPQNVCVEDSGDCGGDSPKIKWHPGHYMLLRSDAPQSHLDDIRGEPTVLGAQIRYQWTELEPRKDQYDFSRIESDLNYLASMPTPKRLVVQILDREFHTDEATGSVPDYLLTDPQYNGGVARSNTGYVARLWDPVVMDRVIALYRALAKRFNREPYFEGITTAETSLSINLETPPPGYSREALAGQFKRLMTESRKAWPNTNVFFFTNYLVGELEGLISHAHETRIGVGGPDVTPRAPSYGARIIMGIDGGVRYVGKLPIAFAVQSPELCGKEGCNLPRDLYAHAVNDLGANYIFWLRFGTNKDTPTEKYSWREGMLPVIRASGGKTNPACPGNFRGACASN